MEGEGALGNLARVEGGTAAGVQHGVGGVQHGHLRAAEYVGRLGRTTTAHSLGHADLAGTSQCNDYTDSVTVAVTNHVLLADNNHGEINTVQCGHCGWQLHFADPAECVVGMKKELCFPVEQRFRGHGKQRRGRRRRSERFHGRPQRVRRRHRGFWRRNSRYHHFHLWLVSLARTMDWQIVVFVFISL